MKKFSVSVFIKGFSAAMVKQHITELTLDSGIAFALLAFALFASRNTNMHRPRKMDAIYRHSTWP